MGGSVGKDNGSYEIESHSRHGSIVSAMAGYEVDPPGYTATLESPADKKSRKRSHIIAYVTMFLMSIGQSIVVSGVFPYLQGLDPSKGVSWLGFVIAMLPLGQLISSPVLGWAGNRLGSIRLPCLITCVLFIAGNVLYSMLDLFGESAFVFMCIARFIIGLSTGNVTLCRLYVAAATTKKERTLTISIVAASQALGFVVGPGIQSALVPIGADDPRTGELVLDMYTGAGWVSVIMGIVNLIILLPFCFQEYYIAEKEQAMLSKDAGEMKLPPPNYYGLFGILSGYFCSIFVYVLIESMATPLVMDLYGLSNEDAVANVGIALMSGGALSVLVFIGSATLTKKFDERIVMYCIGFIPLIIGCVLFIPFGGDSIPILNSTIVDPLMENITSLSQVGCNKDLQPWCEEIPATPIVQLLAGFVICIAGYAAAQGLTQAIFSKILGPKPAGIWFGVLTMMGSLSRIIGPIFVSAIYTDLGTIVTFSVLTGIMIVSIVILIVFHKQMAPMKIEPSNNIATDSNKNNVMTNEKV